VNLFEAIVAKLKEADLGQCATDGIIAFKEVMKEKVPQGLSPVKGGEWVDWLNAKYSFRKAKNFTDFADLNLGEKRYLSKFNQVSRTANSAEFQYDSSYKQIAEQHHTGNYDYGMVKPRNLIPQSKEQLPQEVLSAVKESFIKQFK
jgi:hypothetical protein